MAGTKRGADSDSPNTRASKVAKKDNDKPAAKAKKGGAKKGPKAMATSTFKSKALPLHINLTHTPPSIPDADTVPAAPTDPGHLGSVTLVAAEFSSGSYGWKGNKRLTIELQNPEGGEKEKVTVQLTINATVLGSKGPKKGDKEEDEKEKDEEAAEESAEVGADEE